MGQTPPQIFMNDAFLEEAEQITTVFTISIKIELQQVVVPRNSIVLDDVQVPALQSAVDPLSDSNNYRIELYEQAKSVVFLTQRHAQ